jgi:hypothetical protein
MGGSGLRFALEAAFLIAVAIAAGLAELNATTIVLVMAAAWVLVAAIEWLAWRESPRVTYVRAQPSPPEEPVAPAPPPEVVAEEPRRRRFWRRRKGDAPSEPGEDTQDLPPPVEEPTPVSAEERAS